AQELHELYNTIYGRTYGRDKQSFGKAMGRLQEILEGMFSREFNDGDMIIVRSSTSFYLAQVDHASTHPECRVYKYTQELVKYTPTEPITVDKDHVVCRLLEDPEAEPDGRAVMVKGLLGPECGFAQQRGDRVALYQGWPGLDLIGTYRESRMKVFKPDVIPQEEPADTRGPYR
ncbi:hypothetical protein KY362_02540, partial [Candidatus Woesearchaeota archaeon]|nr:hypothetical protein [Candidatus Woesearchaeota archaeon]